MQAAKFPNMGFMQQKKFSLIFILIIASHLSASFAGGQRKLMHKSTAQEDVGKVSSNRFSRREETLIAHPRFLTVKTNDYGSYDPAPTFAKPPFKLIPN